MALAREQFEYLVEGSDDPVTVTIKPADRRTVAQQNDLSEITVAEYYDRVVHAACVRAGLTDADFDTWYLTLDAGPSRVEGDEPGEATATPATS